jgi:hypothetical protein
MYGGGAVGCLPNSRRIVAVCWCCRSFSDQPIFPTKFGGLSPKPPRKSAYEIFAKPSIPLHITNCTTVNHIASVETC